MCGCAAHVDVDLTLLWTWREVPKSSQGSDPGAASDSLPTNTSVVGRRLCSSVVGCTSGLGAWLSVVGRTFFAGQARLSVVCCRFVTTPQPRYAVSTYNVQPTDIVCRLYVVCRL